MKTFKQLRSSLEPGNDSPRTEKISKDSVKSSSRFWGTKSLSNLYKKETPGQIPEDNNMSLAALDEPSAFKKKTPKNKYNNQTSDANQNAEVLRVQR